MTMLRAIVTLARWVDYQIWGLEPPTEQELRRPARITCHRHGQRRRAQSTSQDRPLFPTGQAPWERAA